MKHVKETRLRGFYVMKEMNVVFTCKECSWASEALTSNEQRNEGIAAYDHWIVLNEEFYISPMWNDVSVDFSQSLSGTEPSCQVASSSTMDSFTILDYSHNSDKASSLLMLTG